MNKTGQTLCVWCGAGMLGLWIIGFLVFADFVPPPSPQDTPQEVAAMYRENTNGIRVGLVLTVFGSALLAPFIAVISVQLHRIEGRSAPLAYAQLALGAALPVVFILPIMFLQVAAFRPDRPAQSLQDLNDIGWLMFIAVVSTAVVEILLIGLCILQDTRPEPVFPRWAGYYNLWVGLLLMPGGVTVFFKHGPLAWNGLLTWWVPLAVFASWLAVMTVLLLRAIDAQARAAGHGLETLPDELRVQVEQLVARLVEERGAGAGTTVDYTVAPARRMP